MNLFKIKILQNIKLITALAFLFIISTAQAAGCPPWMPEEECDLCGCTTSGGNFGYGTLGNTNFVGVRYIYQQFESRDGIFDNSPMSEENFNTYQLWTKIPVYKNTYVTATIPYQDLYRKFEDRTEHINGLGDISVLGWYKIKFNKKQESNDRALGFMSEPEFTGHSIEIGAGLKLPTGEFEEVLADAVNPGFQVGTGSTDVLLSLAYSYSKDRFGANATTSYYVKGTNDNEYRFGNQFSYNANVFYGFPINMTMLTPFVGVSGDFYDQIEQYGDKIPDTDGYSFVGTLGAEYSFKRFVVGANYGLPIKQELFGGDVEQKNRLLLYFNYTL